MSGRIFEIEDPQPVLEVEVPRSSSKALRTGLILGGLLLFVAVAIALAVFVGPAQPGPASPTASPTPDLATGGAIAIVMIVIWLIVALIGLAFYFIPTIVATSRSHHQAATIAVINIFLGWTFIGWVVALAMAVSAVRNRGPNGHF